MQKKKEFLVFVLAIIVFLGWSINTGATNWLESDEIGLVDFQVEIPDGFTATILLDLKHEKEGEYSIRISSSNGYKVEREMKAGLYYVYSRIVSNENENCPSCGSAVGGYTISHLATVVVVRGRINPFPIKVKSNLDEVIVHGSGENGGEVFGQIEQQEESGQNDVAGDSAEENNEKKTLPKKLIESVGGDDPEVLSQKENMGKRLLKDNFLTLIMLLILCGVSVYIELKRRI